MTCSKLEDLPVWKGAVELAVGVDGLVQHRTLRAKGDLANQLKRAARSVSNNIADLEQRAKTNDDKSHAPAHCRAWASP